MYQSGANILSQAGLASTHLHVQVVVASFAKEPKTIGVMGICTAIPCFFYPTVISFVMGIVFFFRRHGFCPGDIFFCPGVKFWKGQNFEFFFNMFFVLFKILSWGQISEEDRPAGSLSRSVANELLLLALLSPLAVFDLAAPYHNEVFSTDAIYVYGSFVKPLSMWTLLEFFGGPLGQKALITGSSHPLRVLLRIWVYTRSFLPSRQLRLKGPWLFCV